MKESIVFRRDSKNVNKPFHLKDYVFLLFAPRNVKISPIQCERQDTDVVVSLPENSQGYLTSKFRTDEIEQISCNKQRLWIGILNKSLTEDIEIKKNSVLGFFVLKTKANIEIKHETQTKKAGPVENIEKEHKREVF